MEILKEISKDLQNISDQWDTTNVFANMDAIGWNIERLKKFSLEVSDKTICYDCGKEITEPVVKNEYGVNVCAMPDQTERWHYYCYDCSEKNGILKLRGLTIKRNKLNREISTLKKASPQKT